MGTTFYWVANSSSNARIEYSKICIKSAVSQMNQATLCFITKFALYTSYQVPTRLTNMV